MKYNKNPYDSLADSILNNLSSKGNSQDPRKNQDLDASGLSDDFLAKAPNVPAVHKRSLTFSKLEAELDQIMKDYENASGRISLKSFRKRVVHWEKKAQNAKVSADEKELLLASGTMARRFSSLWSEL